MTDNEPGHWIDEATRKEIVSLLRESRDLIRMTAANGGTSGNIGRIEAAISKLTQR